MSNSDDTVYCFLFNVTVFVASKGVPVSNQMKTDSYFNGRFSFEQIIQSYTFSLYAKCDFVCLILIGIVDGGSILCDLYRWIQRNSKSKHRCSVDEKHCTRNNMI